MDHRPALVMHKGLKKWMPMDMVLRDKKGNTKECHGECGAKNFGPRRHRCCEYAPTTGTEKNSAHVLLPV